MAKIFNVTSSGGGKMKLDKIRIVTQPKKMIYKSGEAFDPTGMTIEAIYTNGAVRLITGYTVSPMTLYDDTTSVIVSFAEGGAMRTVEQEVTVLPGLSGIEVATAPNKVQYLYLESFDPTGMTVNAVYSNGSKETVSDFTCQEVTFSSLGTHEIVVSYTEDGITKTTTQTVTVSEAPIDTPVQSGALVYNGSTQSPIWDGYNTNTMEISGVSSAIDSGTYQAVFTPKYGYIWRDGSTNPANVSWSIGRASVSLPSPSGNLTYNGSVQSITWNGYDPAKMTIGGMTSGTDTGNYNATFTPNGNYQWSDGSTEAKSVEWTINKAAGSLTLSTSSVTLDSSHLTASVTVTRPGDGTITARSNNTGVATVSVSGTTVTIHNVNQTAGTATITINVAADTNYTAPSNKKVSVTAQFMPAKKALNDQTWAEIRQVSDAGQGANYWSVGDRKGVLVNGTVGTLAVNTTLYVYILGFNHNRAKEGAGIQFGTFKTALSGGTDVCLVDSYYNKYESYNGIKFFQMNHWGNSSNCNTNHGGWKACDMRYDILGSTNKAPSGYGAQKATSAVGYDAPSNTATSPVANTLMAALPYDLRAVMKPITKYTDNVGNSSNVAGNVTESVDYLPLLAEFEISGSRTRANQYEQNSQEQYAYYSAGNSKVKYCHSATDSGANWWGRSPTCNNASSFCEVNERDTSVSNRASRSIGLAPVFMV